MKTFNVVFLKTIEPPLMYFYHSTDDIPFVIFTGGFRHVQHIQTK